MDNSLLAVRDINHKVVEGKLPYSRYIDKAAIVEHESHTGMREHGTKRADLYRI